jgi:tail tube protein
MPTDQRSGVESALRLVEETAYGVPGTEAYDWLLGAGAPVGASRRNFVDVPIYKGGTYFPFESIKGIAESGGAVPTIGDFGFIGRLAKNFYGTVTPTGGANYARADVFHRWYANGRPMSYMLEAGYLEATAAYIKSYGHKMGQWDITGAQEGPVTFNVTDIGSGQDAIPTSSPHDATPTDEQNGVASYLDGFVLRNGVDEGAVTGSQLTLNRNAVGSRRHYSPYLTNVIAGKWLITGRLAIAWKNEAYLADARAGTIMPLECVYGDAPVENGFTKWFRWGFAGVRFAQGDQIVGGGDPLSIDQAFRVLPVTTGFPAEIIAKVSEGLTGAGYNIPASSKLGVKVDGGATVEKTITTGANRTAAQIVTDLLASGGIAGATSIRWGGSATEGGRPAIRTTANGPLKTLQIDAATVGSVHTILGMDTVVHSGSSDPFFFEVLNPAKATDY